ncbi:MULTISPECIES: HNH endonuclease [Allofournierella]|uniref:HNH endonuclease n=1 Tax=Allofournierella TaxID=1940255 RepID=UPI0009E863E9|nr:hypothetical protein B5G38_12000 [Gemmiger sp. An87]
MFFCVFSLIVASIQAANQNFKWKGWSKIRQHIIPVSKGGRTEETNLQTLC